MHVCAFFFFQNNRSKKNSDLIFAMSVKLQDQVIVIFGGSSGMGNVVTLVKYEEKNIYKFFNQLFSNMILN